MASPRFAISLFLHKKDTCPRPKALTWDELRSVLTHHSERADKDGPGFSPVLYRPGSKRGNEGVESVTLAVLDFDGGATLEQLRELCAGFSAIVYSTWSHDPAQGQEKYRLVMPLTRPVPTAQWPAFWKRLHKYFDFLPDVKAKDAARMYHLPSCPPERLQHKVAQVWEGQRLDPDHLLAQASPESAAQSSPDTAAPLPASTPACPAASPPNLPAVTLSDKHRQLLKDSAISPHVMASTGYATIPDTAEGRARGRELGFGRTQMLVPALHVPAHDVYGNVCPGQIRPDVPRRDHKGKAIKYETPAGARNILDVPPLARRYLGDPTVDLWVTEGRRKADSGVSNGLKCCISVTGVYGWRGKNEQGGTAALPCWESIALKGRRIYLVFDSDVMRKPQVAKALERLKAFLESRGATVLVVYLPEGPEGEKTGLDDFFARGGTVDILLSHATPTLRGTTTQQARAERAQQRRETIQGSGRPLIEVHNRQLTDILSDVSQAVAGFNTPTPTLFHGPGGLTIVESDRNGQPALSPVSLERMQVLASKAASWVRTSERDGPLSVSPPRDLCANFLQSPPEWRAIPPLDGIKTAPFFDGDGALCAAPGYHAGPRVWLNLPSGFVLPDTTPTPQNVERARTLVLETLLGEVAFADQSSRAHAVALMLLPFVRPLISGQTPLHLFDAPVQSSGKTYAAQICIKPFGEAPPVPEKRNDEECRKSLFALFMTGPSHVFFDNIKGRLSDPTLAAAITSEFLQDRLIGTGSTVKVSTGVVWVATSNNAQLDPDAASRSIVIRLDTNQENPEAREFRGDPLRFVAQNRAQVIGALLTLVRHWQAQGARPKSGRCRSRFNEWERVMGGILESNAIGGFLDNIEEARANLDTDADAWRTLVDTWHEEHGSNPVTAKELYACAQRCEEMVGLIGERDGQVTRFGKWLALRRDKVFNGFKIVRVTPKSNRGWLWTLRPMATTPVSTPPVGVAPSRSPSDGTDAGSPDAASPSGSDGSDDGDDKSSPPRGGKTHSASELSLSPPTEGTGNVVTSVTSVTASKFRRRVESPKPRFLHGPIEDVSFDDGLDGSAGHRCLATTAPREEVREEVRDAAEHNVHEVVRHPEAARRYSTAVLRALNACRTLEDVNQVAEKFACETWEDFYVWSDGYGLVLDNWFEMGISHLYNRAYLWIPRA